MYYPKIVHISTINYKWFKYFQKKKNLKDAYQQMDVRESNRK